MHICVTGRSHLASLRDAIDDGKFDTGQHEITFIGAPSVTYLNDTYVEDGVLRARGKAIELFRKTSNSKFDRLDPKDFDAVVIYGSSNYLQNLMGSILRANPHSCDGMSSGFLTLGVRDWLSKQPTIAMIKAMRARSDAPIVLMFEPFFSVRHKDRMPKGATMTPAFRNRIFHVLREVTEEAGAICLFQPEETICDVIYSPHELLMGARLLSNPKVERENDDLTHLNSTYGAIALAHIFKKIGLSK